MDSQWEATALRSVYVNWRRNRIKRTCLWITNQGEHGLMLFLQRNLIVSFRAVQNFPATRSCIYTNKRKAFVCVLPWLGKYSTDKRSENLHEDRPREAWMYLRISCFIFWLLSKILIKNRNEHRKMVFSRWSRRIPKFFGDFKTVKNGTEKWALFLSFWMLESVFLNKIWKKHSYLIILLFLPNGLTFLTFFSFLFYRLKICQY